MEKYQRETRAKQDVLQTIFKDGLAMLKPRTIVKVETLEGDAMCPFCLHGGPVDKFVISIKSGFHRGLGKCPKCGNRSQWKTLRRRWTVKEFVLWCYQYACDGFWSKVNFAEFNKGLAARGIARPFWDRYKELKGEDDETSEIGNEGD